MFHPTEVDRHATDLTVCPGLDDSTSPTDFSGSAPAHKHRGSPCTLFFRALGLKSCCRAEYAE